MEKSCIRLNLKQKKRANVFPLQQGNQRPVHTMRLASKDCLYYYFETKETIYESVNVLETNRIM